MKACIIFTYMNNWLCFRWGC